MRILIATVSSPKSLESFVQLCVTIREAAAEHGLTIPPGILWTAGPGCTNLALDLIGDTTQAEQFANRLTMQLMPAKWSTTPDGLPAIDTLEIHQGR